MIDVEAALVAWLENNVAGVHASTETPSDLDDRLPWLQVVRLGGPYDGFRRDQPTVDISAFAATGPAASDLALQVQEALHTQLWGATTGGAVFSRVETRTGPHKVPYDNPALRRYEATYAFVIHPA
ncbi:hypothetical protein [Nonomuraea wenchangensis]|uniref:Tail terminator n=1 Tax=Nonomuraea wenchangensis TaxID=568860 RepID=A0A1I0EUG7_9ACTN|nr:hypothetical protein [Nonomuraea wenchangensis]SET48244.1 hypothetical protein SAMN05421811_103179 [Nonomuraea wenchangensis]